MSQIHDERTGKSLKPKRIIACGTYIEDIEEYAKSKKFKIDNVILTEEIIYTVQPGDLLVLYSLDEITCTGPTEHCFNYFITFLMAMNCSLLITDISLTITTSDKKLLEEKEETSENLGLLFFLVDVIVFNRKLNYYYTSSEKHKQAQTLLKDTNIQKSKYITMELKNFINKYSGKHHCKHGK